MTGVQSACCGRYAQADLAEFWGVRQSWLPHFFHTPTRLTECKRLLSLLGYDSKSLKASLQPMSNPVSGLIDRSRRFRFLIDLRGKFESAISLARKYKFARKARLPAPAILRSYAARPARFKMWMLAVFTGLFCIVYGFYFAAFAPYIVFPFLLPLIFVACIVIWVLPDSANPPITSLEWLLFAFITALIMWPNYIAIALPGLPWITMVRLTGVPLAFVLLLCVSTSHRFRAELAAALNAVPFVWQLFSLFILIQLLSIAVSPHIVDAFNEVLVHQMSWTAVFFASCFVFLRPNLIERFAFLLWAMSILLGLIVMVEFREGHVPWATHIPSFLKIDGDYVARVLIGGSRAAVGIYRAQGTFSTALGLSEYFALMFPFMLPIAFGNYRLFVRLAAMASIPFFLLVVWLSGSRSGLLGFLISVVLYCLVWAVLGRKNNKNSIFATATFLAFPLIATVTFGLTFFSARIHAAVWGNGAQADSTQARIDQLNGAIPKILSHPWGYGADMAAEILGYRTPAGLLSIDNYYLSTLLSYGVQGFLALFGTIALLIFFGSKTLLLEENSGRDGVFLGPLVISLTNFCVLKSVFSQEDNHPLTFMMMGMVVALVSRANTVVPREIFRAKLSSSVEPKIRYR
jgi:hypothetical protein